MRAAAARTLDLTIEEDDAFTVVGNGADRLPTSKIDAALEESCIQVIESSGLVNSLLSEEAGRVDLSFVGEYAAILDPVDGTSNAEMRHCER
ncbi:MAG: hypothetical protein ABI604_03895 [Nitrospirota bacterium]